MSNEILHDFDIDKITFKKPEKISDKITVFDIKYNKIQNFIVHQYDSSGLQLKLSISFCCCHIFFEHCGCQTSS